MPQHSPLQAAAFTRHGTCHACEGLPWDSQGEPVERYVYPPYLTYVPGHHRHRRVFMPALAGEIWACGSCCLHYLRAQREQGVRS